MHVPRGFPEIIQLIIEDWDWDELPDTQEEIWDQLFFTVFLGEDVKSAEAGYAKRVMDPFIGWNNARKAIEDAHWSENVLETLEEERSIIKGQPGEGYKKKMITILLSPKIREEVLDTMNDAIRFIDEHEVDPDRIIHLVGNRQEQQELIYLASDEISNVGLIKSVLWMFGCGIGREIAPPNNHVLKFLDECKIPGYDWENRRDAELWQIFVPVCHHVGEIADEIGRNLRTRVSIKQTQAGIWYLQATRGLFTQQSIRREINPESLLRFINHIGWDINEYSDLLLDVERIDELKEELKSFYESY